MLYLRPPLGFFFAFCLGHERTFKETPNRLFRRIVVCCIWCSQEVVAFFDFWSGFGACTFHPTKAHAMRRQCDVIPRRVIQCSPPPPCNLPPFVRPVPPPGGGGLAQGLGGWVC